MKKNNFYILVADGIPVVVGEDDGEIYWDGSRTMVFVPLFKSREEATKFFYKVKKSLNCKWTATKRRR